MLYRDAWFRAVAVLGTIAVAVSSVCTADDRILLREQSQPGETMSVTLDYSARGDLQGPPQGDTKPLLHKMSARAQFAFDEKVLPASGARGVQRRAVRYYTQSAVESTVDEKRTVIDLRQPIRLIVCELRDNRAFLFSPAGPLTSEEHGLLEADAAFDNIAIGDLLPTTPVATGQTWKPTDAAVRATFNLSQLSKNEITAKLDQVTAATARIALSGNIAGITSGANTQQSVTGNLIFDRQRNKISAVEVTLTEERGASPIAWGLSAQAKFVLRRTFAASADRLKDDALDQIPLEANDVTTQLVFAQPDGQYRFYYPRGWHIGSHTPRSAVMTMLDNGKFVSECHVLAAKTVAAGTHTSPEEFRNQVQTALGNKFQQLLQEGELPAPKGQWMYRLAVAGTSNGKPSVWYYHLAASPQGNQVVFIFRMHPDQIDQFGALDVAMVSSIEFSAPRTVSNSK